jgi:hypothetical protein
MKQSIKFEIDFATDAIKRYFELGGKENDFSSETASRVRSFGIKLIL